jgi:hypothetical protein
LKRRGRRSGDSRQHVPRRFEIGEVKTEYFRVGLRFDAGGGELREEGLQVGHCARAHAGHGRRRRKTASRLLEQNNVAGFGPGPHGRHKPARSPQRSRYLPGGGDAIDDVHQAERREDHVETGPVSRDQFGATLGEPHILER